MNLLTANYSSCGWRIPLYPWEKRERFHSVLPNQVVYNAHSFGLSAFKQQCLGCEDFVRLLSVAFSINPHFVQPFDSLTRTHLIEAQEVFMLEYTILLVLSVMYVCLKRCLFICSGFPGGPSDDTKVLLSLWRGKVWFTSPLCFPFFWVMLLTFTLFV